MKHPGATSATRPISTSRSINASSLYAMYCVFATAAPLPVDAASAGLEDAVAETGVTIRGFYDIGGFRRRRPHGLAAGRRPRRAPGRLPRHPPGELGASLEPVWSSVGIHRPSEFNRAHVPSCFAGFAPRPWLTVYPFVRSYDWYYLDEEHRSKMLREHGMAGREYQVIVLDAGRVRPRRLRVAAGVRGRRAAQPRRRHAPPARRRGPPPRPRGDPVLHRPARRAVGVDRAPAQRLGDVVRL